MLSLTEKRAMMDAIREAAAASDIKFYSMAINGRTITLKSEEEVPGAIKPEIVKIANEAGIEVVEFVVGKVPESWKAMQLQ